MKIHEYTLNRLPLEIFESRFKDRAFCFFLDSCSFPGRLGRYSIMGAEPFLIFKSKGDIIEVVADGMSQRYTGNPFLWIKKILQEYKLRWRYVDIPFIGGGVGYLSYDLCHFIEEVPKAKIDDTNIPDCFFCFYDEVLVIDNMLKRVYEVSIDTSRRGMDRNTIYDRFYGESLPLQSELAIKSNFYKDEYIDAIEKAKYYIRMGEIYQVNLSQRFTCRLPYRPFELYKRLRHINPAPFCAYLDFGEVKILSSSPERFLKVDLSNRYIETRPIKGTRPRGLDRYEDKALASVLLESQKDRAEHIMIVDLERNDLGRLCEYGTVRPVELFTLESYATVFHLVSTIIGRLRSNVDLVDCIQRCFPGGSITGAPKIRSMEIIYELEPTARSVYTGALGYLGFNGYMDLSIVIRTFIIKGNELYFQFGGGIVADSDPYLEYQETLDKARALMSALGVKEMSCGELIK